MARLVLLVDDDADVRTIVAAMLEDMGCEVTTAEDGFEALAQIRDNPRIDVLLTDVNMPGMDGVDLAVRARLHRVELPVLLLSGRESGSKQFRLLRKPFDEERLAEAMQQAMDQVC